MACQIDSIVANKNRWLNEQTRRRLSRRIIDSLHACYFLSRRRRRKFDVGMKHGRKVARSSEGSARSVAGWPLSSSSSSSGKGMTPMGRTYLHPAMKQLKDQQARYAPRERRLEQVERAEQLLGEIETAKCYPYEYLCFRITGFRPEGWPALVLDGADVQHDLRLFVEDLSSTARQAVEQVDEPVLTVDQVSRRYNVSSRTVTRWRRQGLVARRFVIGGRTKVGFLESSLRRFVTAHRAG